MTVAEMSAAAVKRPSDAAQGNGELRSPKKARLSEPRERVSLSRSPARKEYGTRELDELSCNTIRCLAADMVQRAKSGHPGGPIGCAPMANALFGSIMNFSPENPKWINRDRFVLSNGHACCLQYISLHLAGFKVSMDDLKNFRQLHSKTPGHPECFATPGVEVCTGPLAQGITNAVGMALASHHMAARFNKPDFELFNNYVYVITGDGCHMEGVASEAASLAGHLELGNLIVFYDDNKISIDGSTDLAFTEDVGERYKAYGWNVLTIENGDDPDSEKFKAAVTLAKSQKKPTLIKVRTTIGYGSMKAGSEKTHGAPLGVDDIVQLKKKFGFRPEEDFACPSHVKQKFQKHGYQGDHLYDEWKDLMVKYCEKYPELGQELRNRMAGKLSPGTKDCLPNYDGQSTPKATRVYSGECLAALVKNSPEFIGGCADLAPSCNSKHVEDFQKDNRAGRYIRFGVREHAMAGICNGLATYGCIVPYCATFFVFWGYAWGSVRLSALSGFPVLYIGTHDSIDLGEDGPTHQSVEIMSLMRATPNLMAIRPADGAEVAGAYQQFLENRTGPTAIVLSRGANPHPAKGTSAEKVGKGAYVLEEDQDFEIVLTGSGQEVGMCQAVKALLNERGLKVRVVSMPCWELFDKQSVEYRQATIPKEKFRVYVEMTSTAYGLDRYGDLVIAMPGFGASAPAAACRQNFGFTPEKIVERIMTQYKK